MALIDHREMTTADTTKKTKIIATLGPSASSEAEIAALILAGMDIARINLSHGDRKSHSDLIKNVKKAGKNAADTQPFFWIREGRKFVSGK